MKSSKFTDVERDCGRYEPELDDTFTVRTFSEYVDILPDVEHSLLSQEFQALLVEAEECDPPLPKSALQVEAESLLGVANVGGHLAKWVAFIYSSQVMEEFGTLSFFSRELLPEQLI